MAKQFCSFCGDMAEDGVTTNNCNPAGPLHVFLHGGPAYMFVCDSCVEQAAEIVAGRQPYAEGNHILRVIDGQLQRQGLHLVGKDAR
jgi:hypothetical protein